MTKPNPPLSLVELVKWERSLKSQVKAVQLLGEISITETEWKCLGTLLGLVLKSSPGRQAQFDLPFETDGPLNQLARGFVTKLKDRYPASLAVFLVAQGGHGYHSGDYWSGVAETFKLNHPLDANQKRDLGQSFEAILKDFGLPLFPDLTEVEKAHRYVSLILVHGGIPRSCLPDYFEKFEKLLWPMLSNPWDSRPAAADLATAEVVEDWLHQVRGNMDKPVERFLRYGDSVALDFVNRTRELFSERVESGVSLTAAEIGLPEEVINTFKSWAGDKSSSRIAAQTASAKAEGNQPNLRLRGPQIYLDPQGLVLDLPRQQIPAADSQAQFCWQIKGVPDPSAVAGTSTAPAQAQSYPVAVRDLRTVEREHWLPAPTAQIQVDFLRQNQTLGFWSFEGLDTTLDETYPLLVFEAGNLSLRRRTPSLPARVLILLYPAEADLSFSGRATLVEEWPRLPGPWQPFRIQEWDLSQATALELRSNPWGSQPAGRADFKRPIRSDEAAQRPLMVGGTIFARTNTRQQTIPLYVGQPPSLRIPLVGRTTVEEELCRWRVDLRSIEAAQPDISQCHLMYDLRPHLQAAANYVDLPLSHFLGPTPYGTFTVRVRGPLGRDAEISLRCWPQLTLSGHETIHLPQPETGAREITLQLRTQPDTWLENQGEEQDCRIQALSEPAAATETKHYCLVVAPETTALSLALAYKPPPVDENESKVIRVPLYLGLQRLRWAWVDDLQALDQTADPSWTDCPLKRPLDQVLQAERPGLLLEGFARSHGNDHLPPDHQAQARLYLSDEQNECLQEKFLPLDRKRIHSGLQRVALAEFLDTIRHNQSPTVQLSLLIDQMPGQSTSHQLPLISLTRTMIVNLVSLETQPVPEAPDRQRHWLRWQESVPLCQRQVRFWSCWQPWRPSHLVSIPDTTQGELMFEPDPHALPPGRYLLEFEVVDPWTVPPEPRFPALNSPNVALVETISPAERLGQLKQQIEGGLTKHLHYLECVLILADYQARSRPLAIKAAQYLAHLPQLGDLPSGKAVSLETAKLLLAFDHSRVRLYAILHLLTCQGQAGIEAILAEVERNRLSDRDALDLCQDYLEVAQPYLTALAQENHPLAIRLLIQLKQETGQTQGLIAVGHWVQTMAGWGCIESIEAIQDAVEALTKAEEAGGPGTYFLESQTDLRLQVRLRPNYDDELISLDTQANKVVLRFTEEKTRFQCKKTETCRFITAQRDLLETDHNREAHGGLDPHFAKCQQSQLLDVAKPTYQVDPPREELL